MIFEKKPNIFKRIKNKMAKIKSCVKFIMRHNIKSNNNVLFLSSAEIKGKNLIQLIYYFTSSGYNCYLDFSFRQCLKLNIHGINAISLQGVFPISKETPKNSIVISPNKKSLDLFDTNALKIYLRYLEIEKGFRNIKDVSENDLYYPIGLHPILYFPSIYGANTPNAKSDLNFSVETETLKHVFNTERKIGILFAGAIYSKKDGHTKKYSRDSIKEKFHVDNRYDVFSYITEKLSKELIYIPDNLEIFLNDMESGTLRNKIVLIERNAFSIPYDKYFNVLLKTNFFIHMSGVEYPFCHNQIESMLAGCIPITQFARFFLPHFTHESDSLLFNELDDLFSLLTSVTSGKYSSHLDSMRKGIINYYQNNFSIESFKNKLHFLLENEKKHANFWIVIP